MKVIRFAAVAAAGYILGSRAGRERYEQIRVAAAAASKRMEAYGNGGRFASDRRAGRPSPGGATE